MTIKLTKAQRRWLEALGRGPQKAATGYASARRTARLRLSTSNPYDRLFGVIEHTITPAGRKWLAAHTRKK